MKVYKQTQSQSTHTLFIQPGNDHPENSVWLDSKNKAKMFEIVFKYGVAEVDDRLGQYMIDKKLAASTFLINLEGASL